MNSKTSDAALAARTEFQRTERFVVLIGSAGFGAMIGAGAALAAGRTDIWAIFGAVAVVLAIALVPASANVSDAHVRGSPGCKFAAGLHVISLLAWPLALHLNGGLAWLAPATALLSLVLLASCWRGSSRVIYRIGLQSLMIGALAGHLGLTTMMSV